MKMNKYLVFSIIAIFALTGLGLGSVGVAEAQIVTPLACSVLSSSVGINQNATLTATGGNGTYFWSGQNLNVTNSAGNQFMVSYPNPGNYLVTVSSAGQSANCNVNVVSGNVSSGNLSCLPVSQSITLGQVATFSAVGGNGNYFWSAPDMVITNPTGSGFSASYTSTGFKTLTVASAGLTTNCTVNVLSRITTPGFPNTGGGYNE